MTYTHKQLQELSQALVAEHSKRVERIAIYEDMFHLEWDVNFKTEEDWVMKLPSPEPHNAVKGIVRLMISTKPSIKPFADAPDRSFPPKAEQIAQQLMHSADRRQPWALVYEVVMSSVLAGECYVKVANVQDNIRFLEKAGNTGLARRYKDLKSRKPFLFKVYNARGVFPTYSELGLESSLLRQLRTPESIRQFWGDTGMIGAEEKALTSGGRTHYTFNEYWDYDTHAVWVDGAKNPILVEDNPLGFLPWAGGIVEGSALFDNPEDQRLPFLYPLYKSGYWHAQSYADSIMYSLAVNVGKLPQLVANLNNPEQKMVVDWSVLLGVMKLGINEKITPMDKRVIDEALVIAKNIADTRTAESSLPKQVLGAAPDKALAFASINLLTQAGRLPMVPIQRHTGTILSELCEIPFKWAKAKDEVYEVPSAEGNLLIDPSEYENVRFEIKIQAEFAQDDAARVGIAANAQAAMVWSQERAMEYTGVENPMEERVKIEDDIKRRAEWQALVTSQAQALAAVGVASLLESATGGGHQKPQDVMYRPGEDPIRMCGNCAFFQGPGVPCKVVDYPINPTFVCNKWLPAAVLTPPGSQSQPSGGGPEAPSLFDPNTNQGGGGAVPATVAPAQTREAASGVDRAGNPITSGFSMPLG